MEEFNKTENIKTKAQLESLIDGYISFVSNPKSGNSSPKFLNEFIFLVPSINGKIVKQGYQWVDKTLKEIDTEEKETQAETDKLARYQTPEGLEDWRSAKVKPLSQEMFYKWIDETVRLPDFYNLSEQQIAERKVLHQEIYVFHNISKYKTDEELKSLRPEKPTWAKISLE